jgi:hypothetical protein
MGRRRPACIIGGPSDQPKHEDALKEFLTNYEENIAGIQHP